MDRDQQKEKLEEVFQLDDLQAEYEVEQQVVDVGEEKVEYNKVQERKRKLPLKVRE